MLPAHPRHYKRLSVILMVHLAIRIAAHRTRLLLQLAPLQVNQGVSSGVLLEPLFLGLSVRRSPLAQIRRVATQARASSRTRIRLAFQAKILAVIPSLTACCSSAFVPRGNIIHNYYMTLTIEPAPKSPAKLRVGKAESPSNSWRSCSSRANARCQY